MPRSAFCPMFRWLNPICFAGFVCVGASQHRHLRSCERLGSVLGSEHRRSSEQVRRVTVSVTFADFLDLVFLSSKQHWIKSRIRIFLVPKEKASRFHRCSSVSLRGTHLTGEAPDVIDDQAESLPLVCTSSPSCYGRGPLRGAHVLRVTATHLSSCILLLCYRRNGCKGVLMVTAQVLHFVLKMRTILLQS